MSLSETIFKVTWYPTRESVLPLPQFPSRILCSRRDKCLLNFPMWLFWRVSWTLFLIKETPSGQLGTSYAQSHSSSSGAAPETGGGGIWLPFIGYPQRVSSCATTACFTADRLSHTDTHFMMHLGTRRWGVLLTHSDEKCPMLQK